MKEKFKPTWAGLGNAIPTIDEVLGFLRTDLPAFDFTGGVSAEGVWIKAVKRGVDWTWERNRMHSAYSAYQLARGALLGEST